jgi:tetratricopeptide (TPR) repeat protein
MTVRRVGTRHSGPRQQPSQPQQQSWLPHTASMTRRHQPGKGPARGRGRLTQALVRGGVLLGALLFSTGCGVIDEGKLPTNVVDPETYKTPSGALARYRGAVAGLPGAFDDVMTVGGVITDELEALPTRRGFFGPFTNIDSRVDLSGLSLRLSRRLHRLRGDTREARGFLSTYAPDSSPALAGHLFALEGYAEIFLADLFCSGIPLSTVDFDGNYTLAAGSRTREVYEHAVELFDSALTLSSDSVDFQHLAAVGRGRALLALGRYAEAAEAVAAVPPADYRYEVRFAFNASTVAAGPNSVADSAVLWWYATGNGGGSPSPLSMADREGLHGLDYRSSGDPRTEDTVTTNPSVTGPLGHPMVLPKKYYLTPSSLATFTLASSIEARLIEAEAALQAGDAGWLAKLNALRTDGTFDTRPTADPADDPAATDTLWHAGSGKVAGLRPLADPGTAAARVDLVFRERAFWLYLTGHRQGDLRRLLRQYYPGRSPQEVYPTGTYPGGDGFYGTEIVVPMLDEHERQLNPNYTGCINRDA